MDAVEHACPACGFALGFAPWEAGSPSDEICPSCGIQFGYDDAAGGDPERRQEVYEAWRQHWIAGGMRWASSGRKAPAGWDPAAQLKEIGIEVS